MDYLDITRLDGYDFSARIVELDNCPPHIHDAFELYLILEGSIEVSSTAFQYPLRTGDVFIVNVKEMHRIRKTSENNLVLVLQIDPYKLLTIFPKLDFYWFVCDSYASLEKDDAALSLLREYMAHLFSLSYGGGMQASIEIHDALSQLIMHLIKSFQNFTLGQNGYRRQMARENDSLIQERLFLIQEYIHANYRGKIALEDLGKYLNLSPFYISHLVKSATGISFSDLLGLIRSERSELLLLSSNMSIEQVAYACGFSAVRYFEKHFSRWFKMKPSTYRASLHLERYSVLPYEPEISDSALIQTSLKPYMPMKMSVLNTTRDYTIDCSRDETADVYLGPSCLKISGISHLKSPEKRQLFKEALADLKVEEVALYQLYAHWALASSSDKGDEVWLTDLILFIMEQKMSIMVSLSASDASNPGFIKFISSTLSALEESSPNASGRLQIFLEQSDRGDLDIAALLQTIKAELFPYTVSLAALENDTEDNQLTYNSLSLVPRIISSAQGATDVKARKARPELFDVISMKKSEGPGFEVFNGLISELGEKKPTYYAWRFLAQMGRNLIFSDEGVLVTKTGNQLRLLLFHPEAASGASAGTEIHSTHQFHLKLQHIPRNQYLIAEFTISKDNSLYANLSNMQFPLNLSTSFVAFLNQASEPGVSFRKIDLHVTTSLTYELSAYQAKLIILQMV